MFFTRINYTLSTVKKLLFNKQFDCNNQQASNPIFYHKSKKNDLRYTHDDPRFQHWEPLT